MVAVMIMIRTGNDVFMVEWQNIKKGLLQNLSYVEPSDGELHISKPHVETLYEGFLSVGRYYLSDIGR